MKVWFDFVNLKDARLLGLVSARLHEMGHEILATSRGMIDLQGLLRTQRVKTHVLGPQYDPEVPNDPELYARRIQALLPSVEKFRPDLLVSHSSPEAARVAFGLRIRHIVLNDAPHRVKLAKLTLPLSQLLITSKLIPLSAWDSYGIAESAIKRYDAVDAVAWIRNLNRGRSGTTEAPDRNGARFVVVRCKAAPPTAEDITESGDESLELLSQILKETPSAKALVIAQSGLDRLPLRKKLGKRSRVTRKPVDALPVLTQADLFIGRWGTMATEAALLGVPTIITGEEDPSYIDAFLVKEGLAYSVAAADALALAMEILKSSDMNARHLRTAASLVEKMENPVTFVADIVAGSVS